MLSKVASGMDCEAIFVVNTGTTTFRGLDPPTTPTLVPPALSIGDGAIGAMALLALTCTDGESWSALGFVKLKEKI